jgi:hypothetical protein
MLSVGRQDEPQVARPPREVITGRDPRTPAAEIVSMDDAQFSVALKKPVIKRAKMRSRRPVASHERLRFDSKSDGEISKRVCGQTPRAMSGWTSGDLRYSRQQCPRRAYSSNG